MGKVNIVYALSGGKGVSHIAAFLSCYTDAFAVDMNYLYPSLKRYNNVRTLNADKMIFLNNEKYLEYCKEVLRLVFKNIAQVKESSYVIDIGNLLLSEFIIIFKSNKILNYIKNTDVEISFHCVVSGEDKSFNHRAIMCFNDAIKALDKCSLIIWENRYLEDSSSSGELEEWAKDIIGPKCKYKIIEKESEILKKDLATKMKFVIPLSPIELKGQFNAFSYIRMKNYYRKWETLVGRKNPQF